MSELEIAAAEWAERASDLKAEGWLLADLCGLDRMHLGFDDRFGIVVQLIHRSDKERRCLHVGAPGEPPTVPSVTGVWQGANFMEREAYDMFGIVFEDHPLLARILMPDTWEGHPLRKDYGVGKVPVDFVPQGLLQIAAPGQAPTAAEAGVATDALGQPTSPDGRGSGER